MASAKLVQPPCAIGSASGSGQLRHSNVVSGARIDMNKTYPVYLRSVTAFDEAR